MSKGRAFSLHALRQLPGNLLVQNVAHGERDDDAVLLAEKAVNLAQRVAGIIEADKESLLALRPAHRRFKRVNVRPARLVLLLHLHRIKALLQRQLIRPGLADVVQGRDGEDASINAFVADLRLVLSAAQRDDRPVLELEWGNGAQLLFAPRQVAHDEAAANGPKVLIFRQAANPLILQTLGHDPAGGGRNINANPLAYQTSSHVPFF